MALFIHYEGRKYSSKQIKSRQIKRLTCMYLMGIIVHSASSICVRCDDRRGFESCADWIGLMRPVLMVAV